MAFDNMTDAELQEDLRSWHKQAKVARAMVFAITEELLKRRKNELSDGGGYFTDYGFVPDHSP